MIESTGERAHAPSVIEFIDGRFPAGYPISLLGRLLYRNPRIGNIFLFLFETILIYKMKSDCS